MKVYWSQDAQRQLAAIHQYIAQSSTDYANRMVERLMSRSEQIAIFPFSGRRVPEYDLPQIRELFEGPYRLIYRICSDHIEILLVLHGARDARLG
ncbi:MAG: hypothetical protein RL095_1708 [Verrucomicrobiota bacterium]|jgi:addiction module RelE/StbE family toxin